VLLLVAMYLLYDGVRMLIATDHGQAFAHARHLLGLENALGVAYERSVNHAVSGHPVLAVPLAYAYATLHYVITPIVLVWLWKRRPGQYARARTTLAVATLLGLVGFWLFPTAPPRMLPGFVDTLARYHDWGWWSGDASAPKGLGGLTNEFAAMPSLHVGWAAWCGWQLARNTARRWVRALSVAYPIFMVAVVIGTANHYIADAVAGLAVIVVGAGLVGVGDRMRRGYPASPIPVSS
jgi:PAP2 superfamily